MRVELDKKGHLRLFDFSAVQAYKVAVKMEKDGIAFYQDLSAGLRRREPAAEEIDFLIGEEKKHLNTFLGLLDAQKEAAGDSFEEDDIVSYMDSRVFEPSAKKDAVASVSAAKTAFFEAMHRERRSILFYQACLSHCPKDTAASAALGNIIEEEKRHLEQFSELARKKCVESGEGCVL